MSNKVFLSPCTLHSITLPSSITPALHLLLSTSCLLPSSLSTFFYLYHHFSLPFSLSTFFSLTTFFLDFSFCSVSTFNLATLFYISFSVTTSLHIQLCIFSSIYLLLPLPYSPFTLWFLFSFLPSTFFPCLPFLHYLFLLSWYPLP